jgi:hypothetical protein
MAFLIYVIICLCIIGVLLWGLDHLPIDATIKAIIRVVVIVIVAIWLLLQLLNLIPGGLVLHR